VLGLRDLTAELHDELALGRRRHGLWGWKSKYRWHAASLPSSVVVALSFICGVLLVVCLVLVDAVARLIAR
jgi:hypothetical protein